MIFSDFNANISDGHIVKDHLPLACWCMQLQWVFTKITQFLLENNTDKVYKIPIYSLTHWGRDKMDTILQMTFSNAFSWMKMYEFLLKFHWSLFLRIQ